MPAASSLTGLTPPPTNKPRNARRPPTSIDSKTLRASGTPTTALDGRHLPQQNCAINSADNVSSLASQAHCRHEREHLLKGFGNRNFDAYISKRHEDFRKSDDSRLQQDRLRREQLGAGQAEARARAKPQAIGIPAEPVVTTAFAAPQAAVAASAAKTSAALNPDNFDDLSDFDDDELTFLAGKFQVTLDQLKKVQKLQRMAAKADRAPQEI